MTKIDTLIWHIRKDFIISTKILFLEPKNVLETYTLNNLTIRDYFIIIFEPSDMWPRITHNFAR